MQSIKCELPKAELVGEIEDCIGDACGGGSGLPWPIPPAPPEDPSDPNPWESIIPGGSSDPCETCNPGENPDDDEQTCPLGQIDDGFGNCIDEEDPEPLDCMGEEGGLAYVDACGICVEGTSSNIDCCATLQKILDTISESEGTAYTDDPMILVGKLNTESPGKHGRIIRI